MPETWNDRLRERLASEGITPSAHREAIDEIAEHLNDLHRVAIGSGRSEEDADAEVEAELARMGPLAVAVNERARRRRPMLENRNWSSGIAADFRNAVRSLRLNRGFSITVILTLAIGLGCGWVGDLVQDDDTSADGATTVDGPDPAETDRPPYAGGWTKGGRPWRRRRMMRCALPKLMVELS